MDTITHGIVGALSGKAFFAGADEAASLPDSRGIAKSSSTARAAILACTLGSVFPDIDVFAGPIARNPLAMLEWHRNITHSLVILPLWALLLAAVSRPIAQRLGWATPPFLRLTVVIAFGLGTHLFLDVVTNFGTMLWSPLNYSRPALDWIFIVDFTVTALALLPQLASWSYREPAKFGTRGVLVWAALTGGAVGTYFLADAVGFGFSPWVILVVSALLAAAIFAPALGGTGFKWKRSTWNRAGFAALCFYFALGALHHRMALTLVEKYAESNHLQVKALAALPLPPTLTHWSGLISTPEGVWRTTFHLPGGKPESRVLFAGAKSTQLIDEAKNLRDVQIYLWFARFPLWSEQLRGNQTVLRITDARFFRDDSGDVVPQGKAIAGARANAAGFTYTVVFDADGNLVSHGLERTQP